MIAAGIDCGAAATKAVVLEAGRIRAAVSRPTGTDPRQAAAAALAAAVAAAGIDEAAIGAAGATGMHRTAAPPGARAVEEPRAMARAAVHYFPEARTAVDVGAEQGRAVRLDACGRVLDAVENERCAAGAGAFLDAMAAALDMEVAEMGRLGLEADRPAPINAQCVVFAEAEAVALMHAGGTRVQVSRAVIEAVAGRVASMIRRLGVNPEVVLMGGVARSAALAAALARELELERIRVPEAPEYGAAVGAALLAAEEAG